MKITKAFLAGVALSLSLSATPALAATNLPLPTAPVDVAAAVDAATTPEEIAALVNANPGFEATIIARAMATGGFAIEDIVEAAILADPSKLAIIVEAATEAVPEQASAIVFAAGGAAGMQFGAAGDDTDPATAEIIARAAVRGLEAAYGPGAEETGTAVRSITAELFAFLAEENQLALASAVADETTDPNDTGEGLVEDIQTAAVEDGFGGSDLLDGGLNNGNSGSPN